MVCYISFSYSLVSNSTCTLLDTCSVHEYLFRIATDTHCNQRCICHRYKCSLLCGASSCWVEMGQIFCTGLFSIHGHLSGSDYCFLVGALGQACYTTHISITHLVYLLVLGLFSIYEPEDVPLAFDVTFSDVQHDYLALYLIYWPVSMEKGSIGFKPAHLTQPDIPSQCNTVILKNLFMSKVHKAPLPLSRLIQFLNGKEAMIAIIVGSVTKRDTSIQSSCTVGYCFSSEGSALKDLQFKLVCIQLLHLLLHRWSLSFLTCSSKCFYTSPYSTPWLCVNGTQFNSLYYTSVLDL